MPFPDPTAALSSRQGAFRNHYYEKIKINMSFHDTPLEWAGAAPHRPCRTPS